MRRLTIKRLQIYFEWRDIWVGLYIARNALYICILPILVFKWSRKPKHHWFDFDYSVGQTTFEDHVKAHQDYLNRATIGFAGIPIVEDKAVPEDTIVLMHPKVKEDLKRVIDDDQ